jgi:hypothetical protein
MGSTPQKRPRTTYFVRALHYFSFSLDLSRKWKNLWSDI